MRTIRPKNKFGELEKAVMDKLLQGEDVVLITLRNQFKLASVKSREATGVGFFLNFSLPKNILSLTEKVSNIKADFCFGDVGAKIKGLQYGAGFLLWIKDGKLHMLEGYSYEETWPDKIEEFQLSYYSDPRDIAQLQQQWRVFPSE